MSTPPLPSIPSKPPAAAGNLGAVLSWCFTKLKQKMDGQLPAQIMSYNRTTNRATVQPMISMITTSGQRILRGQLASVPVLALGGGGFFINFPLSDGDVGWIRASDRDISLYLQSLQQSPPNTKRLHSFEDGLFIPDAMNKYTFTPDAGGMVISSYDGTTRVVLQEGVATVYAPLIKQECQTFQVDASVAINLNTVALNINATGTSGTSVTGEVNLPANTIINGRPFMTHEHNEVMTGTDNSGGVV
jgi:hypothetical protein